MDAEKYFSRHIEVYLYNAKLKKKILEHVTALREFLYFLESFQC